MLTPSRVVGFKLMSCFHGLLDFKALRVARQRKEINLNVNLNSPPPCDISDSGPERSKSEKKLINDFHGFSGESLMREHDAANYANRSKIETEK